MYPKDWCLDGLHFVAVRGAPARWFLLPGTCRHILLLLSARLYMNDIQFEITDLKVLTNEKRGGLRVVLFDRSPFKLFLTSC
jgi:hypothetical protein